MSLASIVAISISLSSPIVSRAGFSTPFFLSGEASELFAVDESIRTYTDPNVLLTDGFDAGGATYKAAAKHFAQVPNSGRFKVGKRSTSAGFNVAITFTLDAGGEGSEYWIEIAGERYEVTLAAAEDEDDAATDLATAIDAEADYTATPTANAIAFAVVSDHVVPTISCSKNIKLLDTTSTTSTTTVADLAALRTLDSDWYALGTDVQSKGEIEKVRAYAETLRIMYFAQTSDSETYATAYSAGVTTDVGSTGKASSYANTFLVYSDTFGDQSAFAWASMGLVSEPGEINWAHKSLRGVVASDKLTDVQRANLITKGINWYATFNGSASTFNGITASGEYVDTINLVHFLYARIPEDVLAKLRATKKVPYTQRGLDSIAAVVAGRLLGKVNSGLSGEVVPFCNAPLIAAIQTTDRQARHAPGFRFGAVLEGAINTVAIEGTLTVDPSLFATAA